MRKQQDNNYKLIVDKLIILCYNMFEIKEKKNLIKPKNKYKGENYGLNKRRNKKSNYRIRR